MSKGEFAYLLMVLSAMAVFVAVVGTVSVWSRRGNKP